MICYNQCYDFKMASSFEWRPQNWRSTNPCWAFRREVARNDLVSPLIKTSNDSNQPKRKEKVWPDLLLSQFCVWYLPKGTRNGKLIDVDSMRKTKGSCKLRVDAGGEDWRHWKNLLEIRFAKETTCLLFSMSDFPQFIITFICCVNRWNRNWFLEHILHFLSQFSKISKTG